MINITLAALVLIVISGVLTVLLRRFGLPVGEAAQLAVGLFAAGLALVDYLDRKRKRAAAAPMNLDDFTMSSMRIFFQTFLLIVAARQLLGCIGFGLGFLAFGHNAPPDKHFLPLTVLVLTIAAGIAFNVGKWAGSRSNDPAYTRVMFASFLAVALGVTMDFIFVPEALFKRLLIVGKSLDHYVFKILLGWLMYLIPLLIGIRAGSRNRVTIYLQNLCGGLPTETQLVVASLVHEELKKKTESPRRD